METIDKKQSLVVLTGAGISAESGLATFRASDGLWCNHRIEDVATPEGFARNPKLVHEFYNMRRAQLREVEPNAAHHALAKLAAQWQGPFLLVTQNVDDLHDRAMCHPAPVAGSPSLQEMPQQVRHDSYLIHMHGELKKAHCAVCGEVVPWEEDLSVEHACTACTRKGYMRPHIVWFGETPLQMERIGHFLRKCDLFVSIGTSGNVYPAAGFVAEARANGRRATASLHERGAHTVELNLEPSLGASLFHERIHGPATEVVPAFVEKLLHF